MSPRFRLPVSTLMLLACAALAAAQGSPAAPPAPQEGAAQSQQQQAPLTNQDVLEMLKLGLSPEVVLAKIKASAGKFDTSVAALRDLKAANVPDSVIVAMVEASLAPAGGAAPAAAKPARIKDELTTSFRRLQTSVVTVWSDFGHGTGFIFDKGGLVMTNQHVIGPAEYIAVQFDEGRKIPATLLAASPEKDVAVLWVDLAALPEATVAPLAASIAGEPTVVEGERILTIGSPLTQRKIMTTGIVSKVEARAIISDININPGNSGGPLFNSLGEVVGITTFGQGGGQVGPGISGIVRIEETLPIISEARARMAGAARPEGRLLPVDPTDLFPLEAVKEVATAKKFDTGPYLFGLGEYQIMLLTPTLKYRLATEAEREAAKTKDKRNKKEGAVQGTYRPFEELRNWAEYVGEYKPVLVVRAIPNLGESFWGAVGRGVAANYGIHTRAKLRFKTDFYKMRLFCGDQEVLPIHPGKVAHVLSESNYFLTAKDATYEGVYFYPADAISPACGQARLEVFSEKNPNKADVKRFDGKVLQRVEDDFRPYFAARANRPAGAPASEAAAATTARLNTSAPSPARTGIAPPSAPSETLPAGTQAEAERRYQQALAHLGQGRWAEAESELRALRSLDPKGAARFGPFRATMHGPFGLALLNLGKLEEAEAELSLAVQHEPQDPVYRGKLGLVYAKQSRWAEAEEHLRHAVKFDPDNVEYQTNLKVVVSKQGK